MKAGEVLRLLRISRPTLYRYRKEKIIQSHQLPSGFFEYKNDDVYAILNKDVKRKTYLYARVSTYKQKNDLKHQIEQLKQWAFMNGHTIHGVYSDIASGISFERRKEFFSLLDEVVDYRVERVIITYKDRLSRVGFELFTHLFQKYGTEIVVISEVGNPKLDSEEVFEEIIALLQCYSMKLSSKRRKKSIEVSLDQ